MKFVSNFKPLATGMLPVVLVLLLLFFSSLPPAYAAAIVVNTSADELNTDGDCSLREAIQAANTNSAVDACPAGTGADVITFEAALNGTAILFAIDPDGTPDDNEDGDLDVDTGVDNDLTITGNGLTNTIIDGDDKDRVFHHIGDGTFTISKATIRNGFLDSGVEDGGGFLNNGGGTLNIIESLVTNNRVINAEEDGGGVANLEPDSIINITNSTISGNLAADSGGGVFNSSGDAMTAVNVMNSTISGNTAQDQGGGIFSAQTVVIEDSTISGNIAGNDGGGIAVDFPDADFELDRVTIANNEAESGNGGGIWRDDVDGGPITFRNTIIAGNSAGGLGPDCQGTMDSGAPANPNIIQDDSGCNGLDAAFDIVAQDPLLEPLQLNPPGNTATHALQFGSPAIDAGGISCFGTDQRGVPVLDIPNVGGGIPCDIGAYEFDEVPNINVLDTQVVEGDDQPVNLTFRVRLSKSSPATITVNYETEEETATSGGIDYNDKVGAITFPPNSSSQNIRVVVIGDTITETNETLSINLIEGTVTGGAKIGDGTGVGTIIDNDDEDFQLFIYLPFIIK